MTECKTRIVRRVVGHSFEFLRSEQRGLFWCSNEGSATRFTDTEAAHYAEYFGRDPNNKQVHVYYLP